MLQDCFAVGVVLYALLMSAWPQTKEPGDFAAWLHMEPYGAHEVNPGNPIAVGISEEKHPKWKSLSSPVQDLIRGLLEPDPSGSQRSALRFPGADDFHQGHS